MTAAVSCTDCATFARDPTWPVYTGGCRICVARAITGLRLVRTRLETGDPYDRRYRALLESNGLTDADVLAAARLAPSTPAAASGPA